MNEPKNSQNTTLLFDLYFELKMAAVYPKIGIPSSYEKVMVEKYF